MQTNSFVINKIVVFFSLLNWYFQYSGIYAVLCAIGKAGKTSKIVNWFCRVFLQASKKNYYEGSIVLKILVLIFSVIMVNLKVLFNFLGKHNRTSINKKIFDYFVHNLKSPEMLLKALFALMGGAFAIQAALVSVLRQGALVFSIYGCLSVGFFVLAFAGTQMWVTAVKGCFPYKIILWFFDNE